MSEQEIKSSVVDELSVRAAGDDLEDIRPGVFIKTFGCQMNEYDTQKIYKVLSPQYRPVTSPEHASVVIVNTCSIRDKAEHKLYSLLGELREIKDERPDLLVGVGGCVAQQEGEQILEREQSVDFVFGTHNLSLVPSLIERRRSGLGAQVAVNYRDEWEALPLGITGEGKISVFVSISRGCNKNCTYCIVPTTRGPEVSRAVEEIEREVRLAIHRGAREVVLLGQTVNSYGRDFTPKMRFAELLERISALEGLYRIRFTSPHPQEVREDFFDLIRTNSKICRHVHMPLQSGSDRILRAMNRNYRSARYLEIIRGLREAAPDIAVTTDVIVGFPGETEEDFLQTLALLEMVRFEASYSFMFSPRPGTEAAGLSGQVPEDVKLDRLQRFQRRQDEITTELLCAWVGRAGEILIEGPSSHNPNILCGRLSQNILVNLDDEYPRIRAGDVVKVKITESSRYTLRAAPHEMVI